MLKRLNRQSDDAECNFVVDSRLIKLLDGVPGTDQHLHIGA